MTFALGVGFLFLSLYAGYAQRVYGILFGSILGISATEVLVTGVSAAVGSPGSSCSTGRSCSARSIPAPQRRRACPCGSSPSFS